jgi:CRISPR type III-A-associated protein Csm2
MSDTKEAMKSAGVKGSGEAKCANCGKLFKPREPWHKLCPECFAKAPSKPIGPPQRQQRGSFPEGYPDYFDAEGVLKAEYVTSLAEGIAQELGNARPKMTMHQLRGFYGHVKRQESAVENGRRFREVLPEISKLKPIASERASKDKIPRYFKDFIDLNVDKSTDDKAFLKGFVEHFQAVVAYCAGTIRER